MLKRILGIMLVVMFVGVLAGCEDEIKTHSQTEIKDQPVEQYEVVE